MQTIFCFITNVYDLAHRTPPVHFRHGVLQLLEQLIAFDEGVWGIADPDADDTDDAAGEKAITQILIHGLPGPIACSSDARYEDTRMRAVQDLCRSGGFHRQLFFGQASTPGIPGRWLALYRRTPHDFTDTDITIMLGVWPHLMRATAMNLHLALDAGDAVRKDRALGLVNISGMIEAADENFKALLRLEWPGAKGFRLPSEALSQILQGQSYRGVRIEIGGLADQAYLRCTARRLSLLHQLSPMERSVAERFSAGKRCKEIARELGTSPNTVRNQVSHLYRKLNVHDKAALASLLLRERPVK